MEITSTEKYLTIGAMSFNKRRIKSIKKDGDIILIDATGRQDPEGAPNNVIPFKYQAITSPVFASADDFKTYLLRKSRPVENPVISNIVISNITETTARITCTVDNKNSNTAVTVEYGTTNAYGQTSAAVSITELGQAVIDLTGLLVYAPYFFRVKAVNSKATTYLVGAGFTTAYPAEFDAYLTRVTADAGIVRSNEFTKSYIAFLKNQGRYANVKILIAPEAGSKRRVSGINTYISKLHSPQLAANDAMQATELNQPFLAGNIAPNSKYALQNAHGSQRFLSHPEIAFTALQQWSITMVFNDNWSVDIFAGALFGEGSSNSKTNFYTKPNGNAYGFVNESGVSNQSLANSTKNIGKNTVLTLVAGGNDTLKLYVNSALAHTFNMATNVSIKRCLQGIGRYFYGRFHSYLIQSGSLSDAQAVAEYNFLRSYIPEIENVTIGAQQWATSNMDVVCTPQGNIINEVQINAYTERATNGGFDTDTAWSKEEPATITVSGGAAHFNNTTKNYSIYQTVPPLVANKWYKLTFTISNYVKGSIRFASSNSVGTTRSANGTFVEYVKAGNNTLYLSCQADGGTTLDIDNVSCQEVGWANSQELYDAVYAVTAGTVEQKTYAAVKAAAMWSYYDNDSLKGAVYGKLYNWFAAKLLQMDIDYYNAANPSTPWGWRLPLLADLNTLSATLGGNDISGGKMKAPGTLYFDASNQGDNSSGLSMIGSGSRLEDGSFTGASSAGNMQTLTDGAVGTAYIGGVFSPNLTFALTATSKLRGRSIRLIKA